MTKHVANRGPKPHPRPLRKECFTTPSGRVVRVVALPEPGDDGYECAYIDARGRSTDERVIFSAAALNRFGGTA
jgi:hypothetical protein